MENVNKLSQTLLRNCLTLPGERLFLAKRKHWVAPAARISTVFLIAVAFSLANVLLFTILLPSVALMIASILTILLFSATLTAKVLVDWYCHLYIVTSHRILEICYEPLFSDHVSDVLLDQLRVTEVDAKKEGIMAELLNIGDVAITFDRPTHQELFMITGIEDPERVGVLLGSALVHGARQNSEKTVWYQKKQGDGQRGIFRFTEELFPGTLAPPQSGTGLLGVN